MAILLSSADIVDDDVMANCKDEEKLIFLHISYASLSKVEESLQSLHSVATSAHISIR